jgi:peptide deformylase
MKIITIPHPSLREQASPVANPADLQFRKFLQSMKRTLQKTTNPRGVGLAGPQVDELYRVFLTDLQPDNPEEKTEPLAFINPEIINHSPELTLGPDPEKPQLEGCLSMPTIYGPVPRYQWVEINYQTLQEDEVAEKKERFDGFHARVIQHEIDHLDGILFTDHSLKHGLPVYREGGKELVEITDRSILELY